MSSSNGRRRRMLLPAVLQLESRRLLTVTVQWIGQDGTDLVGPNTSVGPDGVQDIHLHLTGLTTSGNPTIQSIVITSPCGFEWEYNNGDLPSGWANAEFFYPASDPSDESEGDLYINPIVDSNLNSSGQLLYSSTGTPITLLNGDALNLTVNYLLNGDSLTDTGSTTVENLADRPLMMPATPTPANVQLGTMTVTNDGQGNNPYGQRGWVHLSVSGLTGAAIYSATLSDQAGYTWYDPSDDPTGGHETLYVVEDTGNTSAELYFPPVRDETDCPSGVSVATDMTLRVTYASGTTAPPYVTQFPGEAWNTMDLANPLNQSQVNNPYVIPSNATNTVMANELINALYNQGIGDGEYDVIELPANATITLTQPLDIRHSVQIIGQNATLKFQASWPSSTPGAIYLDPATSFSTDYLVDFENFNIEFDPSFQNTWYDPENEQNGPHAVLNLADPNASPVYLELSGMSITSPPSRDPEPTGTINYGDVYIGEPATQLVLTTSAEGWTQAGGSITNCTFQGGTVALTFGPWNVTCNTDLGAPANTYSLGAFSVHSPHDVTFANNQVSQSNSAGYEARLINFRGSTYNDIVNNNTFSGGFPGNQCTYNTGNNPGYSYGGFLGAPEIILVENYGEIYEGSVGAISDDGWLLVLPTPSSSVNSRDPILPGEGTGFIVSIMNTTNSNGSANTLAGEWFPIAQQVSVSPPEFLMQSPLPAGSYTISIASASVGDQYTYNTINTGSNPCTAIQLPGNQFGTQVLHNTIIQGGGYVYPWYAIAILLEVIYTDVAAAAPTPTYPYPLETTWTRVPDLGVTIAYNTIENSPGGIEIDVDHGPQINASTGRLYLKAIVDDNTIEWTQAWLNSWGAPDNGASETFYGLVDTNGNPANSPADNSRPPTITVGDGFSVNGRSPATVDNPSGTPNGPKGYVDPNEVNVTVQGNLAEILPSTGAPQLQAEPTGQVYAGVINGVVSPTSAFPYNEPTNYRWADTLYNGQNYYAPYDADNLNINGSTTSGATQVDLSGAYNWVGITYDTDPSPGNLDGDGDSYSATLLGSSVSLNGLSYNIGPPGTNDVLRGGTGQAITLPSGQYSSLDFLGTAVNGHQTGTFIVNYTDGTTQLTQTLDDWTDDLGQSGETLALTMRYRNSNNNPDDTTTVYLYGYSIPLNPAKTVASITLPDGDNGANFEILAIDLIPATFTGTATQLVIQTQPSATATTGAAFATQPVIYEEDQYGNLETGDNSTVVTVSLNSGSGPLQGTTTATVSGGIATFTNLADDTAETISLKFTSPGLTIATSNSIVVSGASASFIEQDTTTHGNWIGAYGTDGYDVINNPSTTNPNSLPAGVTVTPAGATAYTWANPSTATPALEVPGGASRIAAAWYASSSFTVDVDVTNGQSYNLELYVLDYNGGNARSEQIQLSNAGTGAVLSTETVSNFTNGAYLNWTISGNVLITITKTAGANAVLSGLFFDPPTASATFLEQDTTREGSWIGVYGTDGYDVINNPSTSHPNSLPAGVTVTPAGATTYTWANPSTATPALEVPGGASRIAAAWYASSSFTVDVDVTNGQSYNLELYVLDYNGGNARSEQIQLSNAGTGAVLSTETVSNFTNGAYLNWTISGNVLITITKTAGNNAVLSGLFLDPVTDGEQSIKASSVAQQAVAMQTEGSASYGSPAPTAIGTLEFSSNDSQPILFADSRSVVVEVGASVPRTKRIPSIRVVE